MFKKLIDSVKAMIAKKEYDKRIKFALDTLNTFTTYEEGKYSNGREFKENIFVDYLKKGVAEESKA